MLGSYATGQAYLGYSPAGETTSERPQFGKSAIQRQFTQYIQGVAHVYYIWNKTQTGKAAIAKTESRTQTGISAVFKQATRPQTGKAALAKTPQRAQTGVSNIFRTYLHTQQGVAAIFKTYQRTTTGKSAIQKTPQRTQVAISRIMRVHPRTQPGVSAVFKTAERDQTGKGAIQHTPQRDIDGMSMLWVEHLADIEGVAVVARIREGTIHGKSYLYELYDRIQPGIANIRNDTNRRQSGIARIADKPIFTGKKYEYKVYSPTGQYVGTLQGVTSDFGYQQEINSAGSQFTITLATPADNFSEGELVAFRNNVKVYVYDQDTPSGKLMFDGYMSSYTPIFSNGGSDSTKGDSVEIIVLGYGSEFDDYIIEGGETLEIDQDSGSDGMHFGNAAAMTNTNQVGQSFQLDDDYRIRRVVVKMALSTLFASTPVGVTLQLVDGTPSGSVMPIASVGSVIVTSTTMTEYSFTFSEEVQIEANHTYTIVLGTTDFIAPGSDKYPLIVAKTTTSVYPGGKFWYSYNSIGVTWDSQNDSDMFFKVYIGGGSTKAPFLSKDPSEMLRDIIDDYNAKGGRITYTPESIDDTGTTVSYTFNTNSTWEGITKVLELAPENWYFYVDQAQNVLHFHQKVDTPDYLFLLDKHISSLQITKSIETLVNTVYFTGGEVIEGDPSSTLFRKYTRQGSINTYGLRIHRMQDQRVTVAATAGIMANSILNARSAPALQTVVQILDNAIDNNTGYDIENVILGKMLAVAGPGITGSGNSFWDKMEWDVDYWDYDLSSLSTLVLQITKLHYTGDMVTLDLSTVPPDVNKRIEDINRNLEASMTYNNPEIAIEE